ncbi:uncharacterized protein LOC143426000 [Xylocopa sonorina]|uniref:uncharacterized protein LOC143426000 n=1 Tax=Xylocopa sonorina TaxID=1818115 RepID=UPI00403B0E22
MSMLAEPRRKQRWTLNPRGKQWSDDSNKFGQKMLEKMGWTKGKGLGANEQGMTEHVRVSLKDDKSGIGFKKDDLDKAWTEHQDSFNDFLQQLQHDESHNVVRTEGNKGVLSGKSLELKSKQSRARVHYQKFTRGKDVNKYSSKDLANIFGQKELNLGKKEIQEANVELVGSQDNRGGVMAINGGNMVEYFMKKGLDLSKGKKREKNNSESETEYTGFGFTSSYDDTESKESKNTCSYAFENPCVQLDSPENVPNLDKEYRSSKKRKSFDDEESSLSNKAKKIKEEITTENSCQNGIVNAALNLDCQTEEVCDGKEFEVSRVEFGVANSALDLSDEVDCKRRVTFNDHVEYSTDPMKKKKGRTTLDKFEVENKKSKKKKKHNDIVSNPAASGFVNEALDVAETPEEVNDNEINESKSRKSKKKKGTRRSNLETIVEIPEDDKVYEDVIEIKRDTSEENNAQVECAIENDIPIKKKKKKKHKDKIEVVLNEDKDDVKEIMEKEIAFETNATLEKEECEIREDQIDISKRSKKSKKKNKEKDIESNLEKSDNVTSEIETEVNRKENLEKERIEGETVKVKKKKKKSKKDDDTNDVSNEVSIIDEKEISDKENTNDVDEIEVKESKRKKHKKLENESVNDNFTHSGEFTENSVKETNIEANNRHVSSKSFDHRNSSPWNHRAKMSKRLLISLFNRNSIKNFPGSNINEIKGYGADVQ